MGGCNCNIVVIELISCQYLHLQTRILCTLTSSVIFPLKQVRCVCAVVDYQWNVTCWFLESSAGSEPVSRLPSGHHVAPVDRPLSDSLLPTHTNPPSVPPSTHPPPHLSLSSFNASPHYKSVVTGNRCSWRGRAGRGDADGTVCMCELRMGGVVGEPYCCTCAWHLPCKWVSVREGGRERGDTTHPKPPPAGRAAYCLKLRGASPSFSFFMTLYMCLMLC